MTLDEINQELQRTDAVINAAKSSVSPSTHATEWWSVTSAMTMSSIVLFFGLLVLILATYLIRAGQNAESVLRIFGTILIILVAVFLVVAGYTDTQISPVMGLLGTVAGYLLGKETKDSIPK